MPPRASFRMRNEKKHSMVLGVTTVCLGGGFLLSFCRSAGAVKKPMESGTKINSCCKDQNLYRDACGLGPLATHQNHPNPGSSCFHSLVQGRFRTVQTVGIVSSNVLEGLPHFQMYFDVFHLYVGVLTFFLRRVEHPVARSAFTHAVKRSFCVTNKNNTEKKTVICESLASARSFFILE